MGFAMLSFIIAVRNYAIAIILAWMGFSAAPADDSDKKSPENKVASVTFAIGN